MEFLTSALRYDRLALSLFVLGVLALALLLFSLLRERRLRAAEAATQEPGQVVLEDEAEVTERGSVGDGHLIAREVVADEVPPDDLVTAVTAAEASSRDGSHREDGDRSVEVTSDVPPVTSDADPEAAVASEVDGVPGELEQPEASPGGGADAGRWVFRP